MNSLNLFRCLILSSLLVSCDSNPANEEKTTPQTTTSVPESQAQPVPQPQTWIKIKDTIRIEGYFSYLDSLVAAYDSITPYPLSEHLLVRSNPWIIDTLSGTDYYQMMARDSFVYNQKRLIVLMPTDSLLIPDSLKADQLLARMKSTEIDINIPEFKLRIFEDSILQYTFPVRVGQDRKRHLEMVGRELDLRTKEGEGIIINHVRDPEFYNPVNGKQFYMTKRDDEKTTLMPQIPWIETEINGLRNGQMIHPTTNPKSLGKAYSNGCIGTKESDAWVVYYYAPIGTLVKIRYDLAVYDEGLVVGHLKDVYNKAN